jgi:hypothetical protein
MLAPYGIKAQHPDQVLVHQFGLALLAASHSTSRSPIRIQHPLYLRQGEWLVSCQLLEPPAIYKSHLVEGGLVTCVHIEQLVRRCFRRHSTLEPHIE